MSKLNKIFLAIVVALLFTALAEVVFIFVYKAPQQIPSQTIAIQTPSPTPSTNNGLAINPKLLLSISNWPAYPNQHTTITNDITGTIQSIEQPGKTTIASQGSATEKFIYIRFVESTGHTGYRFTQQQWDNSKVFDTRNGTTTPIKISDLAPGNVIDISEIFNADTSDGSSPTSIIISRIK